MALLCSRSYVVGNRRFDNYVINRISSGNIYVVTASVDVKNGRLRGLRIAYIKDNGAFTKAYMTMRKNEKSLLRYNKHLKKQVDTLSPSIAHGWRLP